MRRHVFPIQGGFLDVATKLEIHVRLDTLVKHHQPLLKVHQRMQGLVGVVILPDVGIQNLSALPYGLIDHLTVSYLPLSGGFQKTPVCHTSQRRLSNESQTPVV